MIDDSKLRFVVVKVENDKKIITFVAPYDEENAKSSSLIYTGEEELGGHILVDHSTISVFGNQHHGSLISKYWIKEGDLVTVVKKVHRDSKWDGKL